MYVTPAQLKEYSVTVKTKPPRKIDWVNKQPKQPREKKAHQVIKGPVGEPMGKAKECKSPLAAWELFFDHSIITTIVKETNKKIAISREKMPQEFKNNKKNNYVYDTDAIEIYALFGLMYLR